MSPISRKSRAKSHADATDQILSRSDREGDQIQRMLADLEQRFQSADQVMLKLGSLDPALAGRLFCELNRQLVDSRAAVITQAATIEDQRA